MTNLARFRMLIDGSLVEASGNRRFRSLNPATGEPWALVPEANELDTVRAVESAHCAFLRGPWATMLPVERGRLLRKLAAVIADHAHELATIETRDTGKLFKETRRQAEGLARNLEYYGGLADKVQGDTFPSDRPNTMAFTVREPLGPVAAIIPWNSQLQLTIVKLGPALAAGNTIVLKASEHAAAALLKLGELVVEAGFPPGVVNIVSGYGEPTGRVLTSHPLVRRIAFTGGVRTARDVVRNSAENLAPMSLELGGKSPVIVFDDADVENAVNGIVGGIFAASGQSCVAGSRLYVHQAVAEEVLSRLVARAEAAVIGDPLDERTEIGPLATRQQLEVIETNLAAAREQGLKVLTGGQRPTEPLKGWYFRPTIVEAPSNRFEIVDRELFGPVLTVIRFSDEDEVVELANDSQYGFACGVFTRDSARSLRMARAIRAGVVWINTYRMLSPTTEYGGQKNSGYGREAGMQAIYDYTQPKLIWINTAKEPLPDPLI
jgi:acyl-CoA reductase-like NAD-dependent aldehyde dehydrogenase